MLRINEAIAAARAQGRRVLKKDIAARLWPDSTPEAQKVNMHALCTGETRRVDPDWVREICLLTGCTADYLLGLSD